MWKIVLIVVTFFIVIAIANGIKKSNEKSRQELERKEREKKEEENNFVNKVKDSSTIKEWVDEIALIIAKNIESTPYLDWEFHIKAYGSSLCFGMNLQDVWLELQKEYISHENVQYIKKYNFAKYGLPELSIYNYELDLFSITITEMVVDKLNEKNISVKSGKRSRYVDIHGYARDSDNFINKIVYTHPKAGKW